MPRPTAHDNDEDLISALHQLPRWFIAHELQLREELGDQANHDRQAHRLASALREASQALALSKSLRRQQTYKRDDLLEDVQAFLGTAKIILLRRFRQHPGRTKILEDFKNASPSTLRYPAQAQAALGHFLSALSVHGAALDGLGKPVSEAWNTQAKGLVQAFQAQHEASEQAQQRYLQAQKHRDSLKEQAADLLRDAELAARAVATPQDAVCWELKLIFDQAKPHKRKRKRKDPVDTAQPDPVSALDTDSNV